MKNITSTLHNLATEAKAEEGKIVGKHRKVETSTAKAVRVAHKASVHAMHTGQIMWVGLSPILVFEAARPAWARFVETPIADLMFGNHGSSTVHAASTVAQHFIG